MDYVLRRAKSKLVTNGFTALCDKGYNIGSEFKMASGQGIDTMVAVPAIGRDSQAPCLNYNAEHFD